MMPLGMANVGDVNIIKKINGRDDVRQHLSELGFVVGTEVTVVSELGGNLILSVKESRVALDKTMAMRIMDMGLTKGTEVFVRKVAPLGDPMELTVRGYELSVRKADAELIEVK